MGFAYQELLNLDLKANEIFKCLLCEIGRKCNYREGYVVVVFPSPNY